MSGYEYYDVVLGLIPLSMALVTGSLLAGGFATTTAVPIGAGIAALIVGHALFVNGPTTTVPEPVQDAPASPGAGPIQAD
jgi:hypothetical protein